MVNKKNIWFLTLFSLILVLSVYYVTMPTELLLNTVDVKDDTIEVKEINEVEDANLVAKRVEKEENNLKELDILSGVLTSKDATISEKNEAYDKMKEINSIKSEEEELEKKIKDNYKLDCVITIDGDKISVNVASKDSSTSLANNIMRSIQEKYDSKKYITVKFE